MRIIAGQRRGQRIDGPKSNVDMRPTSDLVRESLFNIVGSQVVGRVAIDLFAGTGAVGLEALSRGAQRAVFIEKNRENVALIHHNIATLRYEGRAQVRLIDAYRWGRTFQPVDDRPLAVFLDPPYREYEIHSRRLNQLLMVLVEKLTPGSVIAVEGGRGLDESLLPEFETWDIRRYGETRLAIRTIASRASGCPQADESGLSERGGTDREEGDDV
jgi:16S rRNA (guanine966-N2)-methyltransferase